MTGRRTFSMMARGIAAVGLICLLYAAAYAAETSKNQPQFEAGVRAYEGGDYLAAFKTWLPLAYEDDPAAQRNLAHLYRMGLGVTQDFEKAAQWYKRASELGLARAQANLANMYLRGQGVDKNVSEAAKWFRRAADQGHVISQYNLGLLYENGLGVDASDSDAVRWYYLAAKGGHGKALSRLALLISKNAPPELARQLMGGVSPTTAPAPRAAAAPAKAAGAASTEDEDQGVRLQATSAPVAPGNPAIAAATSASSASPASPATAPTAKSENGSGGFFGTLRGLFGGSSDTPAPTAPTESAAAQPAAVAPASVPAAVVLDAGLAAYRERDYRNALNAWLPLAESGNPNAQFLLGGLYADGAGVPRDAVRAHVWWSLAASQGHEKARSFLDNLRLDMAPEQIVAASNLFKTWQKKSNGG